MSSSCKELRNQVGIIRMNLREARMKFGSTLRGSEDPTVPTTGSEEDPGSKDLII